MWKTLSSKKIFSHPRITLLEDQVLLPNGTKTDYLKFESRGNSATLICKNEKGQILIQEEYSYPPNKTIIQFPGGAVPKEEDPKDGANRELMEETGYKANSLTLLGTALVNNRRSDALMYIYLATNLEKKSAKKDITEEDIKNYWLTEKEIDQKIKDGKMINVYFLAAWTLYKSKK